MKNTNISFKKYYRKTPSDKGLNCNFDRYIKYLISWLFVVYDPNFFQF